MCDLKQEVEPLQAVPRSAVDDGVATAATVDKCALIGTFIACVTLFSLFGLSVGVVQFSGSARARRRARIAPHLSRDTSIRQTRARRRLRRAHTEWRQ